MKLGSCSIGINPFWLGGIVGFFVLLWRKKQFSVCLIDQLASNQVDRLKKPWQGLVPGATGFNRRRLKKCSLEKHKLYQPKLVAVKMVNHSGT